MFILASENTFLCAVASALKHFPFLSPAGLSAIRSPLDHRLREDFAEHKAASAPAVSVTTLFHTHFPSALTMFYLYFYSTHPFEQIIKCSYSHIIFPPPRIYSLYGQNYCLFCTLKYLKHWKQNLAHNRNSIYICYLLNKDFIIDSGHETGKLKMAKNEQQQ